MARWKQSDGDVEPELDVNDTLAILLKATPSAFLREIEELRKPPGSLPDVRPHRNL